MVQPVVELVQKRNGFKEKIIDINFVYPAICTEIFTIKKDYQERLKLISSCN